jgi:hypothetical protein
MSSVYVPVTPRFDATVYRRPVKGLARTYDQVGVARLTGEDPANRCREGCGCQIADDCDYRPAGIRERTTREMGRR